MTLLRRILIKKINSKITNFVICLATIFAMLILFVPAEAFAAENPCSLTVDVLSSDSSAQISELKIGLCQIASLNNGEYKLTDDFSDSGISLENISGKANDNYYTEIYRYIKVNDIPYVTAVTNSEGSALFSDLDEGMYLIFCEELQNLTFSPYMVYLPSVIDGSLNYNVISKPKTITEEENVKDINVKVLWFDDNNYAGKRPDSVGVTLYRNGAPYRTAVLNEECNWEYTFRSVPADGIYSVRIDDGSGYYEILYEGDSENGFKIIHTLKTDSPISGFVKTGMNTGLFLIALVVLAFAVVLIILSRKTEKEHPHL